MRNHSLAASRRVALNAIAALLLGCTFSAALPAQVGNGPLWTRDSIRSAILGEQRYVRIALPAFYNEAWNAPERFPVLFILDADANLAFAATASAVRIMAEGMAAGSPLMPPLIIVGIETPNPTRFRDFTPPPVKKFVPLPDFPSPGGAPQFLRFLAEELRPYIASRYRTNSTTILAGHSLGGSFTAWAFGRAPNFLAGAVALSPTPGWLTEDTLAGPQVLDGIAQRATPGRLFLASGSAEHYLGTGVKAFVAALRTRKLKGSVFQYEEVADASHGNTYFLGMIPGLRYVFRPVSLASYQLEFDDGEDRLAKFSAIYDSTRKAYIAGAHQLGLPEHLPFNFLGQQIRGLSDTTVAPLLLRMCQDVMTHYPTMWQGYSCAGDALDRMGRASESLASYQRGAEAARVAGDSASAGRLARKATPPRKQD